MAGLVFLFVSVAEDVLEKESHAFDRVNLLALRSTDDLSLPITNICGASMTRTEAVIECALMGVAKSNALRQRALARRCQMQARIQATTPRPI